MKRKIERCWRTYKKHWTVNQPLTTLAQRCSLYENRQHFESYVRYMLKSNVAIEWQDDGGVIIAGVIGFSL